MRSSDAQRAVYRTLCRQWNHLLNGTIHNARIDWTQLACDDPHGTRDFLVFISSRERDYEHVVEQGIAPFIFEFAIAHLAKAGRIADLQWALQVGWPYTNIVPISAAAGGHVDIIDLLLNMGKPITDDIVYAAAAYGHINVLEWYESNAFPVSYGTYNVAASYGYLHVLKWLNIRMPIRAMPALQIYASSSGNIEVYQWLMEKECSVNMFSDTRIASSGHVNVLRWLASNQYSFDYRRLLNTILFDSWHPDARCTRTDVLRWLHDEQHQDVSWRQGACAQAALLDDTGLVMTLYTYGCPLDEDVYLRSAARGNLALFQWLCEKKHSMPGIGCCMSALQENHFHIIRYIHGMSIPCACSEEFKKNTLGVFD